MKQLALTFALICILLACEDVTALGPLPPCEFPSHDGSCPVNREKIVYPGNNGPQSYCSNPKGRICVLESLAVPPAPAWIQCLSMSSYSVQCSAWPKGDMSFDWAVSGAAYIPGGPVDTDTQTIFCNQANGSGLASVEITTSQGLSETVFVGFQCGSIVR